MHSGIIILSHSNFAMCLKLKLGLYGGSMYIIKNPGEHQKVGRALWKVKYKIRLLIMYYEFYGIGFNYMC